MIIQQLPLLLSLIFFSLFIPSSSPSSSSSSYSSSGLISKPGCPNRCGNLSIPFPFGVGPECSLSEDFSIVCTNATTISTTPKSYLYLFEELGGELIEINPTQIRVSVKRVLNKACYNKSGDGENTAAYSFTFYETPYSFSDQNRLTAIGCDDLATTFATDDEGSEKNEEKFGSSCVSYCQNNNSDGVGFCPDNDTGYPPGNGCCVTPIPRGLNQVSVRLTDLSKQWRYRGGKYFSCSYVFIQEKVKNSNQSKFSYPLSYLNNSNEFLEEDEFGWTWKTRAPPVVRLDWRINGAKNCSHARQNASSYACRDNSDCVDYDASLGGYLCRCNKGYQGNPYITGGCQDIDECGDIRTSPCDSNSICINNPGSVSCSCRKGYDGDGRKDGKGCIPSKFINIFIGVGSGFGFILLLSMCLLLIKQRTNEGTIGATKLFHVEELEKATDNFNGSRILGQGGQGIVYKGMLSDGQIVAIKKSKLVDNNQLAQFINEVAILSQINHRNVVKLLGCCLESEVPLLVYEFLPNGTLFELIHDPHNEFSFPWNMRLKIGADIAGALAYLHSASSTPIYHRDIKSSNILLDEKYVVKVSDFGISRSLAVDRTHLTTGVKGTFGYFDPEYFQSNQFTDKSDVYSFGVVLVELLTGQKPISTEKEEEEKSLVTRFLAPIEDNNLDAILDPQVVKEEVNAVVMLARRCLNLQGKMRPTMKEVATELESLRMSQMPANVTHESEETRVYEARRPKTMMISDIDYTWTTSDISEVPSSTSDIFPLNYETV